MLASMQLNQTRLAGPGTESTGYCLRRLFLLFPALFAAKLADPQPLDRKPGLDVMWNDFSNQVAQWLPIARDYVNSPGESPIHVQHEWQLVRKAFHDLDVYVRNL